jgi:hypothetical protein
MQFGAWRRWRGDLREGRGRPKKLARELELEKNLALTVAELSAMLPVLRQWSTGVELESVIERMQKLIDIVASL